MLLLFCVCGAQPSRCPTPHGHNPRNCATDGHNVSLQVSSVPFGSSRRLTVPVRAGADYDRDTGFVAEDNSGRANIFPRKQQAYINSSTSDAAARQGIGGAQGEGCCAA